MTHLPENPEAESFKKFLILVGILLLIVTILPVSTVVNAQQQTKPLKIGERLPELPAAHVLNYQTSSINLNDLKGKLLILEFWSPACGACISLMPRLDSLQRQYKEQLSILLVASEKEEKLSNAFAQNPILKAHPLPSIPTDTILKKLFPYNLIPHFVWISPEGEVLAITSDKELSSHTLEQALKGGPLELQLKKDQTDYDPTKPLLVKGNGGEEEAFLFRSLITPRLPGIRAEIGIQRDKQNGTLRLKATNMDVLTLYKLAYPGLNFLPPKQMELKVKDKDSFEKGIYCFDLQLPLDNQHNARKMVQQSLDQFFDVRTSFETRKTDVWVLGKTSRKINLPKSTAEALIQTDSSTTKLFKNQPLSSLVEWLNAQPSIPPVVDESGFSGRTDLRLELPKLSLTALNAALHPYGLQLRKKPRNLQFFLLELNEKPAHSKPLSLYQ
mgnify:CR=1 FL=1